MSFWGLITTLSATQLEGLEAYFSRLEERDGVHLIHYDGFDADWDEWVSPRRIKAR